MHKLAVQFAASTLVLGVTMVGCRSDSATLQLVTQADGRAEQQAARLNDQARQAMARNDTAGALTLIERAVEMSPQDSGYRLLMADLYLRNGRFQSAEAAYRDVLQLDPGNMRAAISQALMQMAQGRGHEALDGLSQLHGRAPASDLGLAYALAGQPEQAIAILEPAARAADANGRVRQNLALAHALAGNWQEARVIGAQDVSPADLQARLQQWAALARPDAGPMRVASLLNVTPVQDPGMPVHLALAPSAPEAPRFADAAPAPEPQEILAAAEPYEAEQPLQLAEAAPAPLVIPTVPVAPPPAPSPAQEDLRTVAAVRTLVQAQPEIVAPSTNVATPPAPAFERPQPQARRDAPRVRRANLNRGTGRFVVQLGAFSNATNAERAWTEAERRFGLGEEQPVTTTIAMDGRTLHRVSVAGFDSRGDAVQLCNSIRARGGACFVRAAAGDAPVRWAARDARNSRRG